MCTTKSGREGRTQQRINKLQLVEVEITQESQSKGLPVAAVKGVSGLRTVPTDFDSQGTPDQTGKLAHSTEKPGFRKP